MPPTRRLLTPLALAALGGLGLVVALAPGVPPRRAPAPAPGPSAAGAEGSVAPSRRATPRGPIEKVDFHVHLSTGGETRLLELMRGQSIRHAVNLSGGHPLGGLRRQLAAAAAHPGRFTVFASLAYEQAEAAGYGERMAQLLRISHQMGARGLKIAKALGLGLPGPDGKLLPVDDPGLDPVFEAAGELGMPIAIHSGDPRAFWLPVDAKNERRAELEAHPGWSLHGRKVPTFDQILGQLERRVARHPKTRFVSVHFGNAAEEPERVAAYLRRYPNLFIDTAARVPELGRHPRERLRAFFHEFQDRILFGTDLGVGPAPEPLFLGSSGPEPPTPEEERRFFASTWRYFETDDRAFPHPTPIQGDWTIDGLGLDRGILEKVYARNAERLLGLER